MKKAMAVGYTKLRCVLELVGGRQLVAKCHSRDEQTSNSKHPLATLCSSGKGMF